MSDIWLVTGGGRSGKSAYAETLVLDQAPQAGAAGQAHALAQGRVPDRPPGSVALYIATGVATDEEMEERIAHHRAARPPGWLTWERYRGFAGLEREYSADSFGAILLDCVGNLLMGILFEEIPDVDNFASADFERVESLSIIEIDTLCAYAKKHGKRLIFVSNEVGMGLIPETRYSRYYRDALGRINKHIAKNADQAVLMVAGIPLLLK